jgi:hypothetical protein
LLGLASIPGSASAADAMVPKGPVFSVLSVGDGALPENLHYLESPDEGVALTVSTFRRSALLPLVGDTIVFGVPRQNPAEGESRFVAVCSVDRPVGITERALVLLTPETSGLSGMMIDDSERVFPRGTLRVINLVGRPLAARWADVTGEMRPGPNPAKAYPVVKKGPAGQPGRFKLMAGVMREDGQGANLIYSGRVEARPETRTLLVVREVQETALTPSGEVLDLGVSYSTRWVIEALRKPEAEAER